MADDPTQDEPPKKPRVRYAISARVKRALTLLASGEAKTQEAACEAAQLTPRALQLALKRENVRGYLQDEIRSSLGLSATRAARRMHELITSDNAMVSFRASAFALATGAGVSPPAAPATQVNILNAMSPGYLIDLRPSPEKGGPIDEADALELSSVGGVLLGSRRPVPTIIDMRPVPETDAPTG